MYVRVLVHFFSTVAHFHGGISYFLTAATKFHVIRLQQKMSSARESSAITIINGRSVIIGVFTFVRLNYVQENLE